MKLFQILDAIPRKELKSAEKFLQSPYFNQKELPILLFQQLRPWHRRFDRLDKLEVYQQLRPQQAFHAKWWNDHCSELSRLLESFMEMQYLRKTPDEQRLLKRAAMKKYGLEKHFLKISKSIVAEYESKEKLLPIQHFQLWECLHDLYKHSSAADERLAYEKEAQHQLDLYYWTQKLSLQANITSGTQRKELAMGPDYFQAIMQRVDQLKEAPHLLFSYRDLIQYFAEGCSLASYQLATAQFIKNPPYADADETAFLLMIWCNLGSRQFSMGRIDFIQPVFRLYQHGIQKGLFLQQGSLPGNIFINICIMAAQAKATTWLEDFIRGYSNKLEPYLREETLALARAFAAFHQKKFKEARETLDNISSTDLHFRIRLHSLSVRCLLEQHLLNDSFYLVLSHKVRAFKRMIRSKQKLQDHRKQGYLNFADLTLEIAKLASDSSIASKNPSSLYQQVQTTAPLVLKTWLLQKLEPFLPSSID